MERETKTFYLNVMSFHYLLDLRVASLHCEDLWGRLGVLCCVHSCPNNFLFNLLLLCLQHQNICCLHFCSTQWFSYLLFSWPHCNHFQYHIVDGSSHLLGFPSVEPFQLLIVLTGERWTLRLLKTPSSFLVEQERWTIHSWITQNSCYITIDWIILHI